MATTKLNYGIPDIDLPQSSGGCLNPSCFAGHVLVVLFCPAEAGLAAKELADYAAHAPDLVEYDAWLIAVCEEGGGSQRVGNAVISTVSDPAGLAWRAFGELAHVDQPLDPVNGATFLFGRGGALLRVWSGPAKASDVLREITDRHDNG